MPTEPELGTVHEVELTPHAVRVDRDTCLTAATCLAFSIYELDDESKAVLLTANGLNSDDPANILTTSEGEVAVTDLLNPTSISLVEMRALVLESAKACPFNAIIVTAEDGTQIWPPAD